MLQKVDFVSFFYAEVDNKQSHFVTTWPQHKLCDRLYFEFIEEMYGNDENPCIIVLDCDKYSYLTSK